VHGDPGSIAGLGALVAESNILDKFRSLQSFETQAGIDKALGSYQLCLENTSGHHDSYQISLLDLGQTVPEQNKQKHVIYLNDAHPWWLHGKSFLGLTVLLLIPLIVMIPIHGSIMVPKFCYTMVTVIGAAIYVNWHLHVAMLQPYYDLAKHYPTRTKDTLQGSSNALIQDCTSSAISNLASQSFATRWMAACAFMTQSSVIITPALYENLEFIVAAALKDKQLGVPNGVRVMMNMSYAFAGIFAFFALIGFILVMTVKRKPFLPRIPYTLSSVILYLCHGTELLEDLGGMSTLSKEARDRRLTQNNHKYGLGWILDENQEFSRVGIDRLERISAPFKYPKLEYHNLKATINLDCWPKKFR